MEIKLDFSLVLAVYLGLVIFGIFYNLLIGWLERKRYLEGYTSLAVAGGVAVTIGAMAIFNWAYALLVLGSFCASGGPMILGSVWRHIQAREQEQQAERWHWKTSLTPDPSLHSGQAPSPEGRGEEEFGWRGEKE